MPPTQNLSIDHASARSLSVDYGSVTEHAYSLFPGCMKCVPNLYLCCITHPWPTYRAQNVPVTLVFVIECDRDLPISY